MLAGGMTAAAAFAPPRVLGVDRAAMIRGSGLVAATVTSGLIVTIVALPQLTWLARTDAAQPIELAPVFWCSWEYWCFREC